MTAQSSIRSSSSSMTSQDQTKKAPQLRNVANSRPAHGLSRTQLIDSLMPLSRSPWTNTPTLIKNWARSRHLHPVILGLCLSNIPMNPWQAILQHDFNRLFCIWNENKKTRNFASTFLFTWYFVCATVSQLLRIIHTDLCSRNLICAQLTLGRHSIDPWPPRISHWYANNVKHISGFWPIEGIYIRMCGMLMWIPLALFTSVPMSIDKHPWHELFLKWAGGEKAKW